jgi:hypothetical protein
VPFDLRSESYCFLRDYLVVEGNSVDWKNVRHLRLTDIFVALRGRTNIIVAPALKVVWEVEGQYISLTGAKRIRRYAILHFRSQLGVKTQNGI